MKKLISFILITSLVILSVSCSETKEDVPSEAKPRIDVVAQYQDVNEDDWYKDAVDWGVNENIMPASKPKLFGADSAITKEQLILSMWNAAGSPGRIINSKTVPDSDPESDFSVAMNWAVDKGIIEGFDKYVKLTTVTRLEAIEFMWNEASNPMPKGIDNFDDTEGLDSVQWAKDENIALGVGRNLFAPNLLCTKAHMITFLFRAK